MKKGKCKITGRDVSQDIKVKGKFPNREKTLHTKTTSTEVCNLINEYEEKLGFLSSSYKKLNLRANLLHVVKKGT